MQSSGPPFQGKYKCENMLQKKLQPLALKINNWGWEGGNCVHEVLNRMKKGSREHCLRVFATLSRWQMLQGRKGRFSHTMNAEVSQQFVGGCRSLHSSERNQPSSWKKNPFGAIKNEGVISGQKVFGPQIVAVCKLFCETPALSCHLLLLCLQDLTARERVTKPGSSLVCLFLMVFVSFISITCQIWRKTPKATKHLLKYILSPTG